LDRSNLFSASIKHATRPNGSVNWTVFEEGYFGHQVISSSSSGSHSDSDSSFDSDYVFLYEKPGSPQGREICRYSPLEPIYKGKVLCLMSSSESEMEVFPEDILQPLYFYTDMQRIDHWRSKNPISSTGNEEDVVITPCAVEKVCIQRPKGVVDEMYHMYLVVLEEFGVKIPFTAFEMDVLHFLNVAPSQIQPNNWAFIRGFEIQLKEFVIQTLNLSINNNQLNYTFFNRKSLNY